MTPWAAFILVLLAAAALLAFGTAALTARLLLRPPRMSDHKALHVLNRLTPADVGLRYEPADTTVHDVRTGRPLRLAGWWMPHPDARGRCAVLVHGYADAKIGAIAWAPTFHSLGWNVFALDLRAHGDSEGDFTTAGYYERHDLNQVFDRLRIDRPNETRRLVLFGLSMGAAVVSAAAADREDLDGVILDSPFADFRHAVMAHCDLVGLPGPWLQRLAVRFAQWQTGADWNAIRPVDLLPALRCPTMLVESGDDPFLPPADAEAMHAAIQRRASLPHPTVHWRVEDVSHLTALHQHPQEYRRRLAEFLDALPPV